MVLSLPASISIVYLKSTESVIVVHICFEKKKQDGKMNGCTRENQTDGGREEYECPWRSASPMNSPEQHTQTHTRTYRTQGCLNNKWLYQYLIKKKPDFMGILWCKLSDNPWCNWNAFKHVLSKRENPSRLFLWGFLASPIFLFLGRGFGVVDCSWRQNVKKLKSYGL